MGGKLYKSATRQIKNEYTGEPQHEKNKNKKPRKHVTLNVMQQKTQHYLLSAIAKI